MFNQYREPQRGWNWLELAGIGWNYPGTRLRSPLRSWSVIARVHQTNDAHDWSQVVIQAPTGNQFQDSSNQFQPVPTSSFLSGAPVND